jgi:hypothetical protein
MATFRRGNVTTAIHAVPGLPVIAAAATERDPLSHAAVTA